VSCASLRGVGGKQYCSPLKKGAVLKYLNYTKGLNTAYKS